MTDLLDGLTPTEYLIMDVMAARYRLGDSGWTFPNQMSAALGRLSRKDYLDFKPGVVQGTQLAWLTDKGARFLKLDKPYIMDGRRLGRVWGQKTETFTCPRCMRTSTNPYDACEGYCGACHDWTGR